MRKIFIIFSFVILNLVAKPASLDSLNMKIKRAPHDSARIDILYKACIRNKFPARIIDSLFQVFSNYRGSKNCETRSFAWMKFSQYYVESEQPNLAIEYLVRSLKVADSCNNERMQMWTRYWMAFVNKVNFNTAAAKENAHISIAFGRKLNNQTILANNYTLLGNMYKTEMVLDSALFYHLQALEIRKKTNNKRELALTYNNLGLVYKNMNEFKTALDYMYKSIQLKIEIKDQTLSSSYNNLGIIFFKMKQYDSAIVAERKGMVDAIKYKKSESLVYCIDELAKAYDEKKDLKNALHYFKRLKQVGDSVYKGTISTQFQEMQTKYESDKKDLDLKMKNESLKMADELNSRKNFLIIVSSLALLLAIIAAIFIFRSYKQSKRNALQLSFKNKVIEEKNKEITDSINYAKNIQQSLITSEKVFSDNLKDHFILYLPKDIVSGDFYWAQKVNTEFIIMCADCTGHGVPGAFMSLMGIGNLKELVNQKQLTRPDTILNELRERIVESFGLNSNKDGMDASLVKLNGYQMQVAAANNPIWIIRNNENIVVKPDKFPVGNYLGELSPFTLNTIQLQPNDLVLMYTDGYADQFGGPDNKKHKNKAIEKLILENHHLPLDKIKQLLFDNFQQWKGTYDQVDDVLVMGFRV